MTVQFHSLTHPPLSTVVFTPKMVKVETSQQLISRLQSRKQQKQTCLRPHRVKLSDSGGHVRPHLNLCGVSHWSYLTETSCCSFKLVTVAAE